MIHRRTTISCGEIASTARIANTVLHAQQVAHTVNTSHAVQRSERLGLVNWILLTSLVHLVLGPMALMIVKVVGG